MKVRNFITVFLLAAFAISCGEKKEKNENLETPNEIKENFSVEIDFIAPKDDHFTVFYTEDNTINFPAEQAVWRDSKGQPGTQKLVFDLPEEVVPTDIRLDFGINPEQGDVTLEKFKFVYYGKSFEAKGSDLFKYFRENESVKTRIDESKGTITFLKNPEKFYPPFYYPYDPAINVIKDLTGN